MHFPTDNADYLNDEFINIAIKYNASGITVHANQFINVVEFQSYNLLDNRKRIIEFFNILDEEIKGTDIYRIKNLPIIGNLGDALDPIFIYPRDFTDLVNLELSNVGITWDIYHWSINYLTRLGISKLLRQEEIEYKDFHKYLSLMDYIKHFHFSSFKHLTIPYSEVRCFEGENPVNESIDESLLHETLLKLKNNTLDKNIGIVFEVKETDYTNRKRSWETLNWFQVIDANDLVILSSLLIAYTVGEMIYVTCPMTFVANIAPEHLRGTYMGAANLQWITGNAFGPLLGGVLLDQLLGHMLFTILGVVVLFLDLFTYY